MIISILKIIGFFFITNSNDIQYFIYLFFSLFIHLFVKPFMHSVVKSTSTTNARMPWTKKSFVDARGDEKYADEIEMYRWKVGIDVYVRGRRG